MEKMKKHFHYTDLAVEKFLEKYVMSEVMLMLQHAVFLEGRNRDF